MSRYVVFASWLVILIPVLSFSALRVVIGRDLDVHAHRLDPTNPMSATAWSRGRRIGGNMVLGATNICVHRSSLWLRELAVYSGVTQSSSRIHRGRLISDQ